MSYLELTASLSGGPAGVVLLLVFIAVIYTLFFVGSRMLRGESRNVDAVWRYRWRRPLGARRPGQDDLDTVANVPSGLLRWLPLFRRHIARPKRSARAKQIKT